MENSACLCCSLSVVAHLVEAHACMAASSKGHELRLRIAGR